MTGLLFIIQLNYWLRSLISNDFSFLALVALIENIFYNPQM
jgi:hypothetical protein